MLEPHSLGGTKGPALAADTATMSPLVTLWVVLSPFAILGCLKGRYALSIVGMVVLFGIPTILTATRLARTDSWWARRFYDDERLREADERYRSGSRINAALTL
jgi:hypothetical protein